MAELEELSALLEKFSAPSGGAEAADEGRPPGGEGLFGDLDLETLMKLMDAFSRLNSGDKNTELLLALKPHLRDENRAKVDRAIKLMKLYSVFTLLRESGLTDKIL
ncbi:MAG: hypothetical protein NC084_09215 [Bacteroides sp.]|nr:hypothetical protein [Eubacterium sp.]MCM1419003.1 hypothetical protein [Roseburia sp.]MCM1462875.1 hypothetical protein [Bacteroides sp.]